MAVNQLFVVQDKVITYTANSIDSIGNLWYESNNNTIKYWGKNYKQYTNIEDIATDFAENTKTNQVLQSFFNLSSGTFKDTKGTLGVIKTQTQDATEGYTLIKNIDIVELSNIDNGVLRLKHSFIDNDKEIDDIEYDSAWACNSINVKSCIVYNEDASINKEQSLKNFVNLLNNLKVFNCIFQLIVNNQDENNITYDIKINTMSYGDLHRIDVESFGFDDNLISTAGDKVVDLGLYLLTNNKQSYCRTNNLLNRLNNFSILEEATGKLTISYKENEQSESQRETLTLSLNNIKSVEDIYNIVRLAIIEKRADENYTGIFNKINIAFVNNEIVFIGDAVANGGAVLMHTTPEVEENEIDVYGVLYFDGLSSYAENSFLTQPVLGTDCIYQKNSFITDYIKEINDNSSDAMVNVFMSNVNYSFKDLTLLDNELKKLSRVVFFFNFRNALDSKYFSKYYDTSAIRIDGYFAMTNDVDSKRCLARKLTFLGAVDIKLANHSKRIGDVASLELKDVNVLTNTTMASIVADNGFEQCFFGKQVQDNINSVHNNGSSFGLTNKFYVNYLQRCIAVQEINSKSQTGGLLLTNNDLNMLTSSIDNILYTISNNRLFNPDISQSKINALIDKMQLNENKDDIYDNIKVLGYTIIIEDATETSNRNSLKPYIYIICAISQAVFGFDNIYGITI